MIRPDARSPLITVLLIALVAFGPLSTDMYLPSLPSLVRVFETDVPTVQLTLSAFMVAFALSMLVYGPLSDRFGRRPVLIGGTLIYVLASVACALAPTIEVLIGARVLQAFGACAGPVIGRAVVRDVWGRDKAATVLAYIATAMALAPAIGPILGGWLDVAFGWASTFWALAGFSGLALAMVVLLLGETNAHRNPDATSFGGLAKSYGALLRHPVYLGYVLTVSASYSVIFCFISGSSFVLIDVVGLTPDLYGLSFAGVVIGFMTGSFTAARISSRLGGAQMILMGGCLTAIGGLVMAGFAWTGAPTVWNVVGPQAFAMIGVGFIMPNAQAGAIGPFPTMAGAASALMGFTQMGLAALVGLGIAVAFDGTARPMATGVAIAGVLALSAFLGLVRGRG
ncbi:MAG: multidrug effflux MFS transporter [Alphaproteobacteria bacterium]|nr:multidrug effflux MFS transporter [Alphaproteobacteria bacterium]